MREGSAVVRLPLAARLRRLCCLLQPFLYSHFPELFSALHRALHVLHQVDLTGSPEQAVVFMWTWMCLLFVRFMEHALHDSSSAIVIPIRATCAVLYAPTRDSFIMRPR